MRSTNIQNVRFLYESGTSTSVSSGRVVGVAGLGTDHLTPAGGITTSMHRQQTLLAARYSPPRPQTASSDALILLVLAVLLLVGSGIALLIMQDVTVVPHPVLIGCILLLAGVATVIPAFRALLIRGAKQQELTEVYKKTACRMAAKLCVPEMRLLWNHSLRADSTSSRALNCCRCPSGRSLSFFR